MDKTSYENWVRVKEVLEECGNTDNFYYRRACAIVSGQPDPIDKIMSKPPLYDSQNDGTET